jgi:hypothetical protein
MIPPVPFVHLKPLAGVLQARGIIVLAFDKDRSACASYGVTKDECRQMARLLDEIADQIDAGKLVPWDDDFLLREIQRTEP